MPRSWGIQENANKRVRMTNLKKICYMSLYLNSFINEFNNKKHENMKHETDTIILNLSWKIGCTH